MSKKVKELKVVELFAGVGGFRIGFERSDQERFKTVWFNQWEPNKTRQYAHEVYSHVWDVGDMPHTNKDIELVVQEHILDIPNHDILVGGFPCQDYSVAKPLSSSKGIVGKKGVLWWSIVNLVKKFSELPNKKRPSILVLENVDRLLKSPSTQRGRDFAVMLKSLDTLGYNVEWRVINAAEYGFPQRRKRVFILGYRKDSRLGMDLASATAEKWLRNGVLSSAFPNTFENDEIRSQVLLQDEHVISKEFGKGQKSSFFRNAGIMVEGEVFTVEVDATYDGQSRVLKDVLISDSEVLEIFGEEYFIDKNALDKWKWLKGAKKIERVNKKTGVPYVFSEGSMAFPDKLERPSRTIITGEGGRSPSRFKHVIRSPESGSHRRLTPLELERLSMFPDNHTAIGVNGEISNNKRAFFIGNALVTGIVTEIGNEVLRRVDRHGI